MAIVVVCPKCRNQMHAPESLLGQVRNCLNCQSPVKILAPAAVAAASPQPEMSLQAITAEQWFVTLPTGQVIGPASLEQYQAAVQRGAIPPQAMVQRADWPQPMSLAEIQTRQQPSAQAAYSPPQEHPTPHGSYWQQLARNPLGTTLFGANVPDFERGYRSPEVLAERARIFSWCWLIPLAILAAGIILPLVASIPAAFRHGPHVLVVAPVMMGYVFAWIFWAPIIYLVGTYLFAGALLEWEWLFNTKQVRNSRAAGYSIEAIRKSYLWIGGIIMGIGGTPPVLAVLGVSCYCLLAAVVPPQPAGPVASNPPSPAAAPGGQPAGPLPPPAGLAVAPAGKTSSIPAGPNIVASPNATVETVGGVTTIKSSGPTSIRFSNPSAKTSTVPDRPSVGMGRLLSDPNLRWEELSLEDQVLLASMANGNRESLAKDADALKEQWKVAQQTAAEVSAQPNDLEIRRRLDADNRKLIENYDKYRNALAFWRKRIQIIKPLPNYPPVDLNPPPEPPTELGGYIARASQALPVDEVQTLERDFARELSNFQRQLSMLSTGNRGQTVTITTGVPPRSQSGPVDVMIEVQLQDLKRQLSQLQEYQTKWNYASRHLRQIPPLEQQLADARQNKPPAFAGPPGSPAPPRPVRSTVPGISLISLELQYSSFTQEYVRINMQIETHSASLRRTEIQNNPSLRPGLESLIKNLQQTKERCRSNMLAARVKLETRCRETGETSKLLDEPLPE